LKAVAHSKQSVQVHCKECQIDTFLKSFGAESTEKFSRLMAATEFQIKAEVKCETDNDTNKTVQTSTIVIYELASSHETLKLGFYWIT